MKGSTIECQCYECRYWERIPEIELIAKRYGFCQLHNARNLEDDRFATVLAKDFLNEKVERADAGFFVTGAHFGCVQAKRRA